MMVQDMFFAGIDTTAHAMGFALYNLAINQEKQDRLREEINSVVPDKNSYYCWKP